jgi:predicted anti-sigma-YlaC factor YlaD
MKQHYSEADLLETYYTQPGDSMPVMMHLAECSECASRYERLEKKVRGIAACEHDKPETFWARQRISIMRRVDAQRRTPVMRYAAAAVLTVLLGGVVTYQVEKSSTHPVVETATANIEFEQPSVTSDPWQSEELKDYQPVVAWESWVEAETKGGDHS